TAGQPRPYRPALHLRVAPPAWLRGTAPEPTGERSLRVDLLGNHPGNRPTAPGVGASLVPGLQRSVLAARPGVATARRAGPAGPPPAASLPPHRPLDRSRSAGTGGLPVVAPRPGSAAGVRLAGDAPERSPSDVPADRRGLRGDRPTTRDLARWRSGCGAARRPAGRSDRSRLRAPVGADPARGLDDLAR